MYSNSFVFGYMPSNIVRSWKDVEIGRYILELSIVSVQG